MPCLGLELWVWGKLVLSVPGRDCSLFRVHSEKRTSENKSNGAWKDSTCELETRRSFHRFSSPGARMFDEPGEHLSSSNPQDFFSLLVGFPAQYILVKLFEDIG